MRIVMVVPGGVDRSGRQRVIPALLWLIERLARGNELLVVALNQEPDYCEYDLLGARIVCLGDVRGPLPELKLLPRLGQLRRALGRLDGTPDLFHAISAGEVGVLAGIAGRLLRVPVVTSIFSGEMAWLPDIHYGWQGGPRGRFAVARALGLASALTAGSRYAGGMLGSRPWHWVPLGVDVGLFDDLPRSAGPPWRLLHVAHINPVKDQEMLLEAVRIFADEHPLRLDWFGQDTLDGKLQARCRTMGLEGVVHFHGFRPLDELLPFYLQAHLLLQSSRHESQGVAVCEAAAAGVPTAGTAVGLVAELAPQAAAAVPVGDPRRLAGAVKRLLQNPAERESLGRAAQLWARQHDADWTAASFERIYRGCIQGI